MSGLQVKEYILGTAMITMVKTILDKKRLLPIAILLCSFIAIRFFKVSMILILLTSGILGAADTFYQKQKEDEK